MKDVYTKSFTALLAYAKARIMKRFRGELHISVCGSRNDGRAQEMKSLLSGKALTETPESSCYTRYKIVKDIETNPCYGTLFQ